MWPDKSKRIRRGPLSDRPTLPIPLATELACALSLKEQDEILCQRVPEHVPLFRKDERTNPST